MQAKKRYILVFVSCAFLAYCYFGGYRLKTGLPLSGVGGGGGGLRGVGFGRGGDEDKNQIQLNSINLPSFIDLPSQQQPSSSINANLTQNHNLSPRMLPSSSMKKDNLIKNCRMDNCFDYQRCFDNFLVYVYPLEPINSLGTQPPISPNYQKILTTIIESRYYTTDPLKACLFVLGIDTLDRDILSEDYVRNVPSRLQRLKHWNNGRNHIIFNLYSGTWPDYSEQSIGFDYGYAILAKASMSIQQLRSGFDISIPLFHKQFPLRSGNTGLVTSNNFPANKKYLLAFKGKR